MYTSITLSPARQWYSLSGSIRSGLTLIPDASAVSGYDTARAGRAPYIRHGGPTPGAFPPRGYHNNRSRRPPPVSAGIEGGAAAARAGRAVLHVDFDYFYAQCEEARKPELKTRPVVVCVFSDRGGDSGAVATANYEARRYGVKSGMPIAFARRRLAAEPRATFLPTDFGHYSDVSQAGMDAMRGFADVFEYVGKDEAYLDVTRSTGGDLDRAAHTAQKIKNAVRERTRLTCSVGVTPNKLLSKIASDYNKPDGLTVVKPEMIHAFLEKIGVRDIPGIGGKTEKRLAEMGMRTMAELRGADVFELQREFGRKLGAYMHAAAAGQSDDPVAEREPRVQYSRIATLRRDSDEYDFLAESLPGLCADLHGAVTADRKLFRSVGVQLVHADMSQRTRTRMLRGPTADQGEMRRAAERLLREALGDGGEPVRRLGVRIAELSDMRGQSSMDMFV